MRKAKQQILRNLHKETRLCFVILFCITCTVAYAQKDKPVIPPNQDKGYSITAATVIPFGNFSSTHLIGIAAEISPSAHTVSLLKQPKVGFTYNGGIAYYLGKKETVSSYPYKYPGFIFIHAFAGAIYIPTKGVDVKLTAGPALAIYNRNLNFNIGSKLDVNYHLNNTIAIGPGIILMKELGTTSLWAASVRMTIAL